MEKLILFGQVEIDGKNVDFSLNEGVVEVDVLIRNFDVTENNNYFGHTNYGEEIHFLNCSFLPGTPQSKIYPTLVLKGNIEGTFNRLRLKGGVLNELIEPLSYMEPVKDYDHRTGTGFVNFKRWSETDVPFNITVNSNNVRCRIGLSRQGVINKKNMNEAYTYLTLGFNNDVDVNDVYDYLVAAMNTISNISFTDKELVFDELEVESVYIDEKGSCSIKKRSKLFGNFRKDEFKKNIVLDPKDFLIDGASVKLEGYLNTMQEISLDKDIVFGYNFKIINITNILNSIVSFERIWSLYKNFYNYETKHSISLVSKEMVDYIKYKIDNARVWLSEKNRVRESLGHIGKFSLQDKILLCVSESPELLNFMIKTLYVKDFEHFKKYIQETVQYRNDFMHGNDMNGMTQNCIKGYIIINYVNFYMIFILSSYTKEESVILLGKINRALIFKR